VAAFVPIGVLGGVRHGPDDPWPRGPAWPGRSQRAWSVSHAWRSIRWMPAMGSDMRLDADQGDGDPRYSA
jgi:hypothetical protein